MRVGLAVAALLIASAVFASVRTRFVQIRCFFPSFRAAIPKENGGAKDGISSFRAAATSLAATIGTGNIAGVAGALLLGGPGAVFWMWVSAFFGMALKYVEILLALRFRRRGSDGRMTGGPMYYIARGLPLRLRPLAYVYAVCGAAAAIGMGNLVQINTVAESARSLFAAFGVEPVGRTMLWINGGTGALVALLIGVCVFGGAVRVGKAAALLVPLMSVFYMACAAVMIAVNRERVPAAMSAIFACALSPGSATSGVFGFTFARAFTVGVTRGVFTHEAGLGTSAIAHAAAETTDFHRQALYGVFETFFDTIVLCTVTAVAVLAAVDLPALSGAEENGALVIRAFSTAFGDRAAGIMIAFSLLLFSFCSMLAFSLYGGNCMEYLFGHSAVTPYRVVFLGFVIVGATMDLSRAWRTAEILNAFMALPNLAAIFLLLRPPKNRLE